MSNAIEDAPDGTVMVRIYKAKLRPQDYGPGSAIWAFVGDQAEVVAMGKVISIPFDHINMTTGKVTKGMDMFLVNGVNQLLYMHDVEVL